MRIDWTQTLIGSPSGPDQRSAGAFAAARMAGILACCLAMGLVIALIPLSGPASVISNLLALSGVLLGGAVGLAIASRFVPHHTAVTGLLALPFLALADFPAIAMLAFLALVTLEMVQSRIGHARHALIVAAAGIATMVCGTLLSGFEIGPALVLIGGWVPGVVLAWARVSRENRAEETMPENEPARLGAIISAMSDGQRLMPYVTDVVGKIDQAGGSRFGAALAADFFPEGNLMDHVLIADRVMLLKALSEAIHNGRATTRLSLRLRRFPAGAGYPAPPRFDAAEVSVHPMQDCRDRAIVIIDMAGEQTVMVGAAPAGASGASRPVLDRALLDRAMHDCVAPFNAGLGFLEMIADPRLAPRDVATYREFAAEAHRAMTEAHRNSMLLTYWLRGEIAGDVGAAREIAPARLVQDALRMLHLRDAAEQGAFTLDIAEDLPVMRLADPGAVRFALGVLIRFGHLSGHSEISLGREGDDLVIRVRRSSGEENVPDDAFQGALELAANRSGCTAFAATGDAERRLVVIGAFAAGEVHGVRALAPGDARPMRMVS